MRYIVVSDLDGTLLDHQTYDFTAAKRAIALLIQREIPLVLNSSKTQAEITTIRQQLDNQEPFVCENGGIICGLPQEQYLGIPRAEFLSQLETIKRQLNLRYQGFGSATVADVVRWTGLNPESARQAMERCATEPLWWQDTDEALELLRHELDKVELQCVKGGRFYHVMGKFDKASCFPLLKAHYRKLWQEEVGIIALGDSPNDLPMLEQADYSIVIPTAQGNRLQPDHPNLYQATQSSPDGWQEGIDFALQKLKIA